MQYIGLYDLIKSLEYGTKLHIGVLFFDNYSSKKLVLPRAHMIHASKICDHFKNIPNGFNRCFRCRNFAIKKALKEKKAFYGVCINGLAEYTHPIVENGKVIYIVYIGNLLPETNSQRLLSLAEDALIETAERDFSLSDCERTAGIIESYIRMLKAVYPTEKASFNPLVENVKNYIKSNLFYPIDMHTISTIFHYNQNYIGRLFKKETGRTVSEYINERRVSKVKDLLMKNDAKIASCALSAGFENTTYFNRVFKKITGLTPTQYMKTNNKQ